MYLDMGLYYIKFVLFVLVHAWLTLVDFMPLAFFLSIIILLQITYLIVIPNILFGISYI